MFTKYVLPLVALGLAGFALLHVFSAQQAPAEPPRPQAEPPRNPFPNTVAGSGVIEPLTENIAVGAPLAGLVVEVQAKVGQRVAAGDALLRLDDRALRAELRWREAMLASAQADLARLEAMPRPEELPVAQALVAQAEADVAQALDQLERAEQLRATNVVTAEEYLRREQTFRMAKARLSHAQAQLELLQAGSWKFDVAKARALVAQAQAQVEQTQTELDRLTVRALVAGQVLQVNVRPGEFVATPPKEPLVVLGNIDQLHVRVDIDEHDIPRFTPGAKARAMLKGRPREEFPLTFVRIEPYVVPKRSLTGENTERVDTRVLQVIYAVAEPKTTLYVGQQLDVFIEAAEEAKRGE